MEHTIEFSEFCENLFDLKTLGLSELTKWQESYKLKWN